MSRSMTGYGRAEVNSGHHLWIIEIKSVNSKHCDVKLHCPRELAAHEFDISQEVRRRFQRGRFDVFIQCQTNLESPSTLTLDKIKAQQTFQLLQSLAQTVGLTQEITLEHLLSNKELFVPTPENPQLIWQGVLSALMQAIDQLEQFGHKEAAHLTQDIGQRLQTIETHLAQVEKSRAQVINNLVDRFKERLSKLIDDPRIDRQRLEMEVALLIDRSDFTEELVRLKSHLKRTKDLLHQTKPATRPIGRELDFIIQEIHREINTLGQKSSELSITELVIQMKAETEKIREQAQNLE